MSDELLTTKQVSERLGVTQYRVQQLIRASRLPAVLYGKVHLVKEADLALVADRKPGRPKKSEEAEKAELMAAANDGALAEKQLKKTASKLKAETKPGQKSAAKARRK